MRKTTTFALAAILFAGPSLADPCDHVAQAIAQRTKATIDTIMKVNLPPGSPVMAAARSREKPDCVSAQAIAVAAPMMSRIAPHSDAVSISIGISLDTGKLRLKTRQTTIV